MYEYESDPDSDDDPVLLEEWAEDFRHLVQVHDVHDLISKVRDLSSDVHVIKMYGLLHFLMDHPHIWTFYIGSIVRRLLWHDKDFLLYTFNGVTPLHALLCGSKNDDDKCDILRIFARADHRSLTYPSYLFVTPYMFYRNLGLSWDRSGILKRTKTTKVSELEFV